MKGFIAIALFSLLPSVYSGCSTAEEAKTVLTGFLDALSKKEFEKSKTFATGKSASMIDLMRDILSGGGKDSGFAKYSKGRYELADPHMEGDQMIIPAKEKATGTVTHFVLKKENGTWKVSFDATGLMRMTFSRFSTEDPGELSRIKKNLSGNTGISNDSVRKIFEEMKSR